MRRERERCGGWREEISQSHLSGMTNQNQLKLLTLNALVRYDSALTFSQSFGYGPILKTSHFKSHYTLVFLLFLFISLYIILFVMYYLITLFIFFLVQKLTNRRPVVQRQWVGRWDQRSCLIGAEKKKE